MNNALVSVFRTKINNENVNAVDARELHAFLEVGRDFSNWIKSRIGQGGFEENEDFVIVSNLRSPKRASAKARDQIAIDYTLSLDMAKHIAMMEKNAKGKQIRQYFIDVEKKARQARKREALTFTTVDAGLTTLASFGELCGYRGNQLALFIDKNFKKFTGISLLEGDGLPAPQNTQLLTPSDIGIKLEKTAREVNLLLTEGGYQEAVRDFKGRLKYEPTELGLENGAVLQDTGKKRSDGTPIRQLKWEAGIVPALKAETEDNE